MADPNKYGVHNRLALLENAVTELRKENADLRTHLAGALQTAVNDAKNVIQGSIRVPQDGNDGRDGVSIKGDQGERGPAGDVLYIGPDEVAEAVKKVRAELLTLRAAMLGRIVQGIADQQGDSGTRRYLCMHLEKIKKDIENL